MQICTLYLPINTIKPNKLTAQEPESVAQVTDLVTKEVERKLARLLRNNRELSKQLEKLDQLGILYTDAIEYRSLRCGLMLSIKHLCKARGHGKRGGIETWMFHINTYWLEINRLVYGSHTTYKDAQNVAYRDNYIPVKQRFYGKRRARQ